MATHIVIAQAITKRMQIREAKVDKKLSEARRDEKEKRRRNGNYVEHFL